MLIDFFGPYSLCSLFLLLLDEFVTSNTLNSKGCLVKTSQNRIHMQSFKDKAPHLVVCLILSDLTCCTVAPLHQALRAAAQLACACHSQTSLIPST